MLSVMGLVIILSLVVLGISILTDDNTKELNFNEDQTYNNDENQNKTKTYAELSDRVIVRKAIKAALQNDNLNYNNPLYKPINSIIPRQIFHSFQVEFDPKYNIQEVDELWKTAMELNDFQKLEIYFYFPGFAKGYEDIALCIKTGLEQNLPGININLVNQKASGKLAENIDKIDFELEAETPSYYYAKKYLINAIDILSDSAKDYDLSNTSNLDEFDRYLLNETIDYIPLFESQKILLNSNVLGFEYNPRGTDAGFSYLDSRFLKLDSGNNLRIYLRKNKITDIDYDSISSAQAVLLGNLYEGLINIKNGDLLPGAAQEWHVSKSGLEYTFRLRDDLVWSDGQAITADDYYSSWISDLKENFAKAWIFNEMGIKNINEYVAGDVDIEEVGLKLVDDFTLRIELKEANADLLYLMNTAYLLPTMRDKFNGPYIIQDEKENMVILKKNENYWNADKISIDTINVNYGRANDDVLYELYKNNELDILILTDTMNIDEEEYSLIDTSIFYYLDFLR